LSKVCLGSETCKVGDELASVLIDFAERAGNNRKDVASVELFKGLLERSHLTICAVPSDLWRMGSVQVESSLTVVPPNGGGTLVGGRICLAVALLVGGSSWLDCLDLAQDVRSATVIGCLVGSRAVPSHEVSPPPEKDSILAEKRVRQA
ncbi:hypothetical protein THAOC_22533, partial [Thalassiosira oceanica]